MNALVIMTRHIHILAALFAMSALLFAAPAAYAACTNPAGDKADIIYNADDNVIQYCDDTNWISGLQADLPPSSANYRKVFVSSASYNGLMGGTGAADRHCTNLAEAAGLSGYYKAWLSTESTDNPAAHFSQSTIPYATVNKIKIADDWTDLIDGSLHNAILYDETGSKVDGGLAVWTNTNTDGTVHASNQSCATWFDTGGSGAKGFTGHINNIWTDPNEVDVCNTTNRLYCFEQEHDPVVGSSKNIFITSSTQNGNLVGAATSLGYGGSDGVEAADYICQYRADNASTPLTGTYKAWISSAAATDPESNFTNPTDPYALLDGIKVADNWTDLIDGLIKSGIMIDENGDEVAGTEKVWTNVSANGTNNTTGDCNNWTMTGSVGQYGQAGQKGTGWTRTDDTEGCNTARRLYCVEQ